MTAGPQQDTGPGPRVSVLPPERHRDAARTFADAYLVGPVSDAMWARSAASYAGATLHAVVEDDGTIGALSRWFPQRLAVPGGEVEAAGVSSVGVRADRRRRGYLRAVQTAQLRALHEAGVVAATLRASEAGIYSRFGYGPASRYATVTVDRARARLRDGAAVADVELDLLDPEDAIAALTAAHDRVRGSRPGTVDRPTWWWTTLVRGQLDRDQPLWVLAARDPATHEIVGWLVWSCPDRPRWGHGTTATVRVLDLVGADTGVELALWQAALGIDLADELEAPGRPVDSRLGLALTDERAARVSDLEDETWLRLVDVEAALTARSWAPGEPVELGVRDVLLPANDGTWTVGADGVRRSRAVAEVVLDVGDLAAVYLGGTSVADLASVGRAEGAPAAVAALDRLLVTPQQPWSGTYF
ncbi:GNAT family N-acetyltransferase [Rhodococcus aerolatus]